MTSRLIVEPKISVFIQVERYSDGTFKYDFCHNSCLCTGNISPVQGLVGLILGVCDDDSSSAHLSGVTLRDEALMYAEMGRRQIGDGKIPSTTCTAEFQQDISKALNDGKHLILVLM